MPSARTIRKLLLHTLEDHILPKLRGTAGVPAILAELPMQLPPEIEVRHLPMPPLAISRRSTQSSLLHQNWPRARVHSREFPYIIFVCEGEAELRMGVTTEMVRRSPLPSAPEDCPWRTSGCHILPITAPGVLLFPAGVPYSNGSRAHWKKEEASPNGSSIMWLHVLPVGVLCHVSTSRGLDPDSEHPLIIRDEGLCQLAALLTGELSMRSGDYNPIAQSLLLALYLRLHRGLVVDEPAIGNTVWKMLTEPAVESTPVSPPARIIAQVEEYVQIFLAQNITLPQLAAHCDISATHLNRIFNAQLGISTMRYVHQQKILAAERMLAETQLTIKEITALIGFRQSTHFYQAFRAQTGLSPRRFRELHYNLPHK